MKVLRSAVVAALLAGVLVVLAPSPAGATVNVNTTANELNSDGDCSLREAIQSVNSGVAADACGSTTSPIVLPAGTYPVNTQLNITATMTIRGAGVGETLLDTSGFGGTLFNLGPTNSFTLEGVTITGGADSYVVGPCGPAGTITVNDSFFDAPASYGIVGCGGPVVVADTTITDATYVGILNSDGDTTVTDSTVSGSGDTGIVNKDGDIEVSGTTVSDSGALGILNGDGDVTLADSAVSGSGDIGILNDAGAVSLTDSTVTASQGVGVLTSDGDVSLLRSTISDSGDDGILTDAGSVSLTNSTVSGSGVHSIDTMDGPITLGSSTIIGGIDAAIISDAEAAMTNSIVVGGGDGTCDLPSVSSGGYNISDDASCGFTQSTDLENTAPELGALADNGGPTLTHLPQAGSPAIDTGGDCPSDDQRSEPRPADGDDDGDAACDRGAVEIQPAEPTPTTTTTTTGAPTPTAAAQPQTPAFTG